MAGATSATLDDAPAELRIDVRIYTGAAASQAPGAVDNCMSHCQGSTAASGGRRAARRRLGSWAVIAKLQRSLCLFMQPTLAASASRLCQVVAFGTCWP
ncbi:hypothetical protein CDD81_4260 [Ophiocordyceps australis]|uniref:Uncharacterized protein n=1 Tax=Ophiocordyceps australis TaxID=1399860 RepID=A0A2C5XVA2_9HYPO|nr:hypothetical protein CDD81_4260 [Ophiocordyceps australis]